MLGLVTTKTGQSREPRTTIKRRIDEAAQVCLARSSCALSPQCGFASTEEGNALAEDEQWAKLRMIVELADGGVELIRMADIVEGKPLSSQARGAGSDVALPCCSRQEGAARAWSATSVRACKARASIPVRLRRRSDAIRKAGGEAIASTLSITEPKNAEAIVRSALDAFGRVDILVNNAGHSARRHLSQDELVGLVGRDRRASERLVQLSRAVAAVVSRAEAPALSCT